MLGLDNSPAWVSLEDARDIAVAYLLLYGFYETLIQQVVNRRQIHVLQALKPAPVLLPLVVVLLAHAEHSPSCVHRKTINQSDIVSRL